MGVAADSAGRWYEVSDAPPGEKDAAGWQRVLAVFVQGKDWQFRGWPFKARAAMPLLEICSGLTSTYSAAQPLVVCIILGLRVAGDAPIRLRTRRAGEDRTSHPH